MSDVVLKLEGITKSFSDVTVLKGVDLELKKNRILALCGENGAGKSTLMNILGGVLLPDSGTMYIDGSLYAPQNPNDARERGIAFIHQELSLFSGMSVKQNFMIDDLPVNRIGVIDEKAIKQRINENLSGFIEGIDINMLIENLNVGVRQLIEIAKEVAKKAKIIIFDEPTTSLSTKEKEKLFKIIGDLSAGGTQIIYISHILDDVFRLCDDILVLRNGEAVGYKAKEDYSIEEVIGDMVGRSLNNLYPFVGKEPPGEEVLNVEGISNKVLRGVSLSIRRNEIVGMFGLMGAGRSELARAIFGLDKVFSGTIVINGERVDDVTPQKAKNKGIAFITENRSEEGLLMPKPVTDNIVLASLKDLTNKKLKFFVDNRKTADACDSTIENLNIGLHDPYRQTASQLSGGNQQKVVIGKWLLTVPRLFILDEPTRGVDVGAKFEIYNHINRLVTENRSGVLFISSEMEELMGVCDRILVMSGGRVTGELGRPDFNKEKMLMMAIKGLSNG